jgi:D-xylulose reductase
LCSEVRYLGSFRYGPGVYQTAIDLVSSGKIDLKPLITHRYSFMDSPKYVRAVHHGELRWVVVVFANGFCDILRAFQAMIDQKGYDGKPPIKVIIDGPVWEGENEKLINGLS